jgi:nitrite reductase/ring-hydroxylating ferredoxin subunit
LVSDVGGGFQLITAMASDKLKRICTREELNATSFLIRPIQFKKQSTSAIIFAFEGKVYAYINHCMHMHRPLNCEQDNVFDDSGKYLRCSMHGFIFDPKTGECQSPVCLGQHLHSLRLEEIDGELYFAEKHLTW